MEKILIGLVLAWAVGEDCCGRDDCWRHCRVQYRGSRNYYNSTDCMCYPVVQCVQGEFFDTLSNTCVGNNTVPEVTFNHTDSGEGTLFGGSESECVNGVVASQYCVCYEGYTTSEYQEGRVRECDVKQGEGQGLYVNLPENATGLSSSEKMLVLCGVLFTCIVIACLIRCKIRSSYSV